ncbi:class I SAM-dependent methyltransferase [Pseudomonas sp. NPDC089734]|uniref:class I SAM-dependent methyltransferase n=1 Tax=Pseudomonas sp. NPDC089734 TaxID=3364469 RepID=UPI00382E3C2E
MTNDRIAQRCICCASIELDRSPAVLMPFVAKRVFGHEPVEITEEWGLRDLQQGMAYTLCASLQCQQCGVLFLDYRFSDQEMTQLYHGYRDERYNRERQYYEPNYGKASPHYEGRAEYVGDVENWLASRVPNNPSVLDWGGGSGLNTLFLGRSKLTHIYDISSVATVEGVEAVSLETIEQHQYDLVICSQVLEHVPYPHELLKQIAGALDEHTLLYLEVPNEVLIRENPGNKKLAGLKRHWHEHVNFFTEQSLRELVQYAGLQVHEIMNLDVNLGWRTGNLVGLIAKRIK